MRLLPLKQWVCDTCGEVIKTPEDGWVEFQPDSEHKYVGFSIVHHKLASPNNESRNGCYCQTEGMHLNEYLGVSGLSKLLVFMDVGSYHSPVFQAPTKNIRNWVEFTRRLQVPYYEEARLYWEKAMRDGFFDSPSETYLYLPDKLKDLVEQYRD